MEIKEKAAELIGCKPISCKSSNVNYCQKHYDKGYMCGEMKRLVEMAKWVEEKKDAQIAEALNQLSDLKGLYFRTREELKKKPIIVLSIGGKWSKCYDVQVNLFDDPEKADQFVKEETCRSHGYFQIAKIINPDTTYEMHGLDEDGDENEVTATITEVNELLGIELPDDKHEPTVAEALATVKKAIPTFKQRVPTEEYKAVEVRQDIDGTHYKFIINELNYQTATVGGIGGDRHSD